MSFSLNGTTGLTFPDASTQATAATGFGFKNRIINGAMMIDQRNAGAATASSYAGYTVDRWNISQTVTGKVVMQQNAGSVTPPTGFKNYLGATSQSAYSLLSGDYYLIGQQIEGYNVSDLGWGTASAQTITVSFWVRSSLTGTFGAAIVNNGYDYSYPFSYTINAANTWEQKTVTIAGPTSGTWTTDNTAGLRIYFSLGTGTTYSGTAGAWTGSFKVSTTGATSVVGTNGATFYITGVQLEKGSTATSFDYRPYGTELALCQRYFEMSYGIGTVPATATFLDMYMSTSNAGSSTTGFIETLLPYKVSKRAAATLTFYDSAGTSGKCTRQVVGVSATAGQNIAIDQFGLNGATVYSSGTSSATGFFYHFTASAEL